MKASVLAMLVLVSGRSKQLGVAGCPGDPLTCHLSCLQVGNSSDKGVCDDDTCTCIHVGCPNNPQGCQYVCSKNEVSKRYRCGGYKNQFCRCFE
ncbi:uncharacterized protein LOC115323444 isoform X2 [Ixodes scapularis]|uniref:uncharacterized protein LOC115323444 isoform X2 n=1 Tax=Ixodes scapularis TaxID=6945 RepID=UPI001A9E504F|nr:uncharacterized protein LOC115323444 isoform X2 [Ixodes scapularis]